VIAGDPLEPLILVALGTGARIGELLGLLWSNVLFDEQELHILGAMKLRPNPTPEKGKRRILVRESFTKARDQRVTRLAPPVAAAFVLQRDHQHRQWEKAGDAWETSNLVFTDDHGRALNPGNVAKQFNTLAARAGLPDDFTFHGLRHSCATF
jgi:integrase